MVINTSTWRIIIGAAVLGIIVSIGGWALSEIRDIPSTYTTVETHQLDIRELRTEQMEQTTRIEEKVDETNQFLRNHFANQPNTP